MEPRGTSYTKLVPSLDDEVLDMIEFVRSFLVGFVASMSGLGTFGLGLGAIRRAVLDVFEFAAERLAVCLCCALLSLKQSDGLVITVT